MDDTWEAQADWWVAGFGDGADPVHADSVLPLATALLAGRRHVLDLGCGEGQLGRALVRADRGVRVVGLDRAAALLAAARNTGAATTLVRGDATLLPFADAAFDAVAVLLVLEHVAELDAALAEVAHVLEPGRRLVLVLNHPVFQAPGAGWVEDHVAGDAYWRVRDYLVATAVLEEVDAGVVLPFHHRPLSAWVNAVADAGLVLERCVEPAPPDAYLALPAVPAASSGIPRLLLLVASRP